MDLTYDYRNEMLKAIWALIPDGITTDDGFAWKVSEEAGMASWMWEHHDGETYSDTWVYASPWWEGAELAIAISLCTEDHDDGLLSMDILFAPPSGDAARDAERYVDEMRKFLSNIRP